MSSTSNIASLHNIPSKCEFRFHLDFYVKNISLSCFLYLPTSAYCYVEGLICLPDENIMGSTGSNAITNVRENSPEKWIVPVPSEPSTKPYVEIRLAQPGSAELVTLEKVSIILCYIIYYSLICDNKIK